MSLKVLTIGHSNHTADAFIRLLRLHDIAVLADVRSVPYSRYNRQFNRENVASSLRASGIDYLYLGDSLGGILPSGQGPADRYSGYAALSRTAAFKKGLASLLNRAADSVTAIMCAEHDPLSCHRTYLVSQALVRMNVAVEHILISGQLVSHPHLLDRLLKRFGIDDAAHSEQLFRRPRAERVELAIKKYLTS